MKKTIIIGATSAIGSACADQIGDPLLLVGRNEERLGAVCADLRAQGKEVEFLVADLVRTVDVEGLVEKVLAFAPEQMILAAGILTNEYGDYEQWVSETMVNVTAQTYLARKFLEQSERGHLVIIGSVAGDRGRQSNAAYGSQKGGLEIFAEGLLHRAKVNEKAVKVSVIKPGYIRSPMTDHLPDSPLFAEPGVVAHAVMQELRRGKSGVRYSPGWWRGILFVVKRLPKFIFHRTKL